jgi:hypothetical protein
MNLRLLASLALVLAVAPLASAQNATTPATSTPAANLTPTVAQQISATQSSLNASAASLQPAIAGNSTLSGYLSSALAALNGNTTTAGNTTTSLSSLKSLSKLYTQASAVKLTPEQTKLAAQVRDEAAALLLQKNISATDPGLAGPVNDVVTSFKSGQYVAAAKELTTMYSSAPLTADQKTLVKGIAAQYAPDAKSAAAAALHSLGF